MKNDSICISCGKPFNPIKSHYTNHCSTQCWQGYCTLPDYKFKKNIAEYRRKLRLKHIQEVNQCKGQPTERVVKLRYQQYKKSAYDRHHSFSISIEYFASFWGKNCYYCNDKIIGIGIDRYNNSVGYEEGNCVPCCTHCNIIKNRMSGDDFINKCQKIYEHSLTLIDNQ